MSSSGTIYPVFFGAAGCTLAMTLTVLGSSVGFALCSVTIATVAVEKPEIVMKALVPVVMASVLSIYGLVVALVMTRNVTTTVGIINAMRAFKYFSGGLTVGLTGLAAGYSIGRVGQHGILAYSQQPRVFVGLILLLIFGEVLGIYGLITALVLAV